MKPVKVFIYKNKSIIKFYEQCACIKSFLVNFLILTKSTNHHALKHDSIIEASEKVKLIRKLIHNSKDPLTSHYILRYNNSKSFNIRKCSHSTSNWSRKLNFPAYLWVGWVEGKLLIEINLARFTSEPRGCTRREEKIKKVKMKIVAHEKRKSEFGWISSINLRFISSSMWSQALT